MKFDLTTTYRPRSTCAKCHRSGDVERHHTGSEHMWLRWFREQRHTVRYLEFEARYISFHPDAIVPLCKKHHDAIHAIYIRIIRKACEANPKHLTEWTWEEAEALMQKLRTHCKSWLTRK